jgi:gamma-butyrobetaine dioxygenase
MIAKTIAYRRDGVSIAWENDHTSEYASVWLRDNDPVNRDPRTGQRLFDVTELPLEAPLEGVREDGGTLHLAWAGGSISAYPLEWLYENCPCPAHAEQAPVRQWGSSHKKVLRRFDYTRIQQSSALRLDWLEAVATWGLAFLSGVPTIEGSVLEVAALVGWVRETNYGRLFDVRSVPDPNNLAYTNRQLGLHTDNPYRDPVPGLEILHCLRAGREGGASLFADGFAVVEALLAKDGEACEILASTPVRFAFSDAVASLAAERSIIQRNCDGRLEQVHYNSRSMAPLRMAAGKMVSFYRAYTAFAQLLLDPRFVVTTSLADGELVICDNRRVLHGRTAFSSADPRHLQGCYLDQDGLRSQITVLKRNGHR